MQARLAYATGDRDSLARLAPTFINHPLEPYLAYWQARLRLEEDESWSQEFIKNYANTFLAGKLKVEWAKSLAKQGRGDDISRLIPFMGEPDVELQCLLWSKRPTLNAEEEQRLNVLWFRGASLPDACLDLAAPQRGFLSLQAVELRLWMLLAAGQWKSAQSYLNQTRPDLASAIGSLDSLRNRTALVLSQPAQNNTHRYAAALIIKARADARFAAAILEKDKDIYHPLAQRFLWSTVAQLGAAQQLPEARTWFELGPPQTEFQWSSAARIALRLEDWARLESILLAMPKNLAADSTWVYWLGRAYQQRGQEELARRKWQSIAQEESYYGLMAQEALGRKPRLPPQAAPRLPQERAQAAAVPCVARALILSRLDLQTEADSEWRWCMERMAEEGRDRLILASTDVAAEEGFYSYSISGAGKTRTLHDYSLRFPRPAEYQKWIDSQADAFNVPNAWIYGLIRQESRFRPTASSWAGAKGLMQIMPATGRWVARSIGLNYHPSLLGDPEANITLGLNYFHHTLDLMNQQLIPALAAYNAGPSNVRKWMPIDKPIDSAIFAETIGIVETRGYVQKILTNIVFYELLSGNRDVSVGKLLGAVRPIPEGIPDEPANRVGIRNDG